MFRPEYLQDRLNAMTLTPEEAEAFRQQRDNYAKTSMLYATQAKLEMARDASIDMLKAFFTEEEHYEMPPINERVLIHHFGFAAKRLS